MKDTPNPILVIWWRCSGLVAWLTIQTESVIIGIMLLVHVQPNNYEKRMQPKYYSNACLK